MRIVTGRISHETHVFSKTRTDLESFRTGSYAHLLQNNEILDFFAGTNSQIGGFIEASKEFGFELVPTLAAGATPSGLVTGDAFDYLLDKLTDGIQSAGKVDGVLLSLHGAMVAEGHDDAEGDILSAVREIVGEGTPIVAVLDLHANVSDLMVDKADVLVIYDTYPHVDVAERGFEAGKIITSIIKGEITPTAVLNKPPMMPGIQKQKTSYHPMKQIMELAHEIERDDRVVNVSIAPGFPWSDVKRAGMSFIVTTNNDQNLAEEKAQELADLAWKLRRDFLAETLSVQDAVAEAMQAKEGPIVLADIADNPTGGAAGDSTVILKELLEAGADDVVIATLADPEAVARAIEAGVGNQVTMMIGGKTDQYHGKPVEVSGRVKIISDGVFIHKGPMGTSKEGRMGKTVLLNCEGIEIILVEQRIPPHDLQLYRSIGIEPTDKKIIVVKSSVHFRAAHEPIAKKIIEVDGLGLTSPRLATFPFKKIRRPIFPLDTEMLGIIEPKKMGEE